MLFRLVETKSQSLLDQGIFRTKLERESFFGGLKSQSLLDQGIFRTRNAEWFAARCGSQSLLDQGIFRTI